MKMDLSTLWTAAALVVFAPLASGFVAPKSSPGVRKNATAVIGQQVLRPALVATGTEAFKSLKSHTAAISVEKDARSGAARLISGGELFAHASLKGVANVDAYVDVAMAYLRQHADVFGVSAKDLQLNHDAVLIDQDVQFLKFNVLRNGVMIADAHLDFRFKQGKLLQVENKTFAEAKVVDGKQVGDLARSVESQLLTESVTLRGDKWRVVAHKTGYQLMPVSEFLAETTDGNFKVQVEKASGRVFEVVPTTLKLQGSASGHVYPRWYNETPEFRPYYELNLTYDTSSVMTDMNGMFFDAPDTAQPKIQGFDGQRVKVTASTGTAPLVNGAQIRENWVVRFERSATQQPYQDKYMAHSMAYAHLNSIIQHAKNYIQPEWFDQQLQVNVNLADNCNAHWDQDDETINFYSAGDGCANTGLIADVVYHEWGHGLDQKTGGIDDGAYSEGFGDVMSLMMTRSDVLGIGFLYPSFDAVRMLEENKVYPTDQGEVHAEGLIIAGTFWDLFKYLRNSHNEAVAADLVSKYALKTIYTATNYTDVYNALLVVDDDNADLSDQTPNYCDINKAFAEHGLTQADVACSLAAIDLFEIDDSLGNRNGVIDPGETVHLWLHARNAAPNPLDGLMGMLSLSGNDSVNATQTALSWDQIPVRSTVESRTPAVIEVANTATCGSSFKASVRLTAGTRAETLETMLDIGQLLGVAHTTAATDLPLPVTDNNTTTTTLAVNGGQWGATTLIKNAHLKFDITHTYIGDLEVALVTPSGVEKVVYTGSGSDNDVHFDQDISLELAGLTGMGDWQLKVTDSAGADEGTLDAAMLTLTPALYQCN